MLSPWPQSQGSYFVEADISDISYNLSLFIIKIISEIFSNSIRKKNLKLGSKDLRLISRFRPSAIPCLSSMQIDVLFNLDANIVLSSPTTKSF